MGRGWKLGRGGGSLLRRSMSAGVTICVPEIHCMFDIVGRGGIKSSSLNSVSLVLFLHISKINNRICEKHGWMDGAYNFTPVPKTLIRLISAGPFQPRISPVLVITVSGNRRTSKTSLSLSDPISFNAGKEYALA